MSVELLSRLQFAGTIMFHYLFPPLTIGLGLIMVLLEFQWLRTRDMGWNRAARFWTRIFALNFALGVSTGIVMEFEFGTNWAAYSRFVGDVFGSALAAEGIFAFFLESGFLAVLVFGWDRVGPRMHFFSSLMVWLGGMFSAVWIVIANSWQQTPAGYHIVEQNLNGKIVHRAEITDFWAMVFNPSSMDRLGHVLIGSMILGAFFVMSISAYYVLRNKHHDFTRRCFPTALVVGAIFSLLALVSGHDQAKMVAAYQPAKLAAFEGHFETGPGDLSLFGWPDADAKTIRGGVELPGMLSWLIHGDTTTPVTGLDDFPLDERPPVWLSFQAYHVMVALGMFFIVLTVGSMPLLKGGRIYRMRKLMWVFVFAVLGPFIANQAGWVAAEVGRQPWVVYPSVQGGASMMGLRTTDGLSESVEAGHVLWSIVMFGLIYVLLFTIWVYVLNEKIRHGPEAEEKGDARRGAKGEGIISVSGERLEPGGDHLIERGAQP
ncbi:MAG: cytochrome ubiquinol oxidase subunit I [Phycisphaerales bacterium]|nr:cytochrome ubiquinol oxidase subunit I [Phycisphaerales bacterium]MCB9855413.1 cytochrome ubiquinol oxidase subunit I [Phycisphaerales bacterium]